MSSQTQSQVPSWQDEIYFSMKRANVGLVPYVPDAGHASLIKQVHADEHIKPVVLTTEEEGIAVAAGAWLGGEKSVLLMQSSGVGNCINTLSLLANCQFPFLALITMRGEWGEFNVWQCPMGQATQGSLELMGVQVHRCEREEEVKEAVDAALYAAFVSDQRIAILLSQKLLGKKEW